MQRIARARLLALSTLLGLLAFGPAAALFGCNRDSQALERALATVDAGRIQADVEFLAADELGGRDSPSPGLRIAARFIRARLVRLGWQPGAETGYFHEYPLDWRGIDLERTWLEVGSVPPGPGPDDAGPDGDGPDEGGAGDGEVPARPGAAARRLVFGTDYYFYPGEIETGLHTGTAVFCGDGEKDDFEAVDVSGKWALCMDGEEHWRRREKYAKAAGALGILTVPGPTYDDDPYRERFKTHLRRVLNPRVSYPTGAVNADGPAFPQLFLTPAAFADAFDGVALDQLTVGQGVELQITESRALAGEDGRIKLENVAGWWPGRDRELRGETIVISAHYDHVGERDNGDIYNGADDNGSGSAALLALAEALADYGPMRRSVLLLWVSAEEKGLLGSRAWTESPWLPDGARAVCNINLDMVGRNAPDSLQITPTSEHQAYNGLTRLAEAWAKTEGFSKLGSADSFWSRSDHANFERNLGIPVAFLFADVHEDYHKPTDTADKIDSDKIGRVTRLVLRMLDGLQADKLGV